MTSIAIERKYALCAMSLQIVLTRPEICSGLQPVHRATVHNMHNFPGFIPALLTYFFDRKGMLVVAQQTNSTSIFD